MRITYANIKASRIPAVVNLAPNDPRLLAYTNEACERIFNSGENFWGLTQRFNMCVYDGCITWPRQVASIESLWVCSTPITIRNQWFEYLESGPLLQGGDGANCSTGNCSGNNNLLSGALCGAGNSYDRGTTCTFREIRGLNKKIRVYADVAEAADSQILLQGYDENGIWIRTEVDGEWMDGEYVDISTTPTLSTKIFTSLVAVQKPQTNGNVRLYEYNTDDATQRALAVYEPSETNPSYRRSLVPGVAGTRCCSTSEDSEDCAQVKITAIAKLEFIPAQVDTDWVLPGNIPALKDMIQAVRYFEMNNVQEAMICEGRAFQTLRGELRKYLGHSVVQPIRRQSQAVAGPAFIQNII